MFQSIKSIQLAGFEGFVTISDLRNTRLHGVPEEMGVYLVLRTEPTPPVFLDVSPAGHFKGQDPTVVVEELRANWVEGTPVLYIGKAGGPAEDATLRSRIAQYLKFGSGGRIGHRGGRLIWQVAGSDAFLVAWKVTLAERPRDVESNLIAQFVAQFSGRRPFANLQD